MKLLTHFKIGLVFLGAAASLTAQAVTTNNCVTPPAGLVAWWPGNGNGNDIVGGNNATVPDGVTYTNAEVGQGFNLDGSVLRITAPDAPQLNFGSNQDFSVEAWIQPQSNPGNYTDSSGEIMTVVSKRYNPDLVTALGYEMFLAGGRLSFQMDDVPSEYHNYNAGPDLRDGNFHHVAITVRRNLTNGIVFYVDGQAIASFDPTVTPGNLSNTEPLRIGNHPIPNLPAFYHGVIDEVSLYNRALSAGEITAIYNAGTAGKCAPAATCVPPPTGIVGWWKGDGTAVDIIGGNNGNPVNTAYTNGVVDQAFSFDPEITGYSAVQIPDQPAYVLTNALTMEGWIRPRGDSYAIFWRGDSRPGYDPYQLSMQGGHQLAFYLEDGNNNYDNIGVDVDYNVWVHVAATYDKNAGLMCLYTNGVLAAQKSTAIQPLGELDPSSSPGVSIGNVNDGFNNFPFIGDVDEIALYNRALSASEIANIYNAGTLGKCAGPFPPSIVTPPASQTVNEGGSAAFSVVATGTAPFRYQWKFNGKIILGATNASLTLTNLHPNQAGIYLVTVASPYGTNSASATLTITTQNILVYKYTGTENVLSLGQNTTFNYSGMMFFLPANTNGAFVGWATIKGKKTYWISSISPSHNLLINVPVSSNQSYTLFGDAGSGVDGNGWPHFLCNMMKGWNASLTIGTKKTFSFPNTFAGENVHAYPNSQTGNMVLDQATSTLSFAATNTQMANNNGQTLADLVNAQVMLLKLQGYVSQ